MSGDCRGRRKGVYFRQGRNKITAAPGGNIVSTSPEAWPWQSRRHVLLAAAGLSLLPGRALAQHITANPPPQTPAADQDSASLAARTDAASHLTVQVHIDGHGPYNFVVDTGAERSVIADTVAAVLNLPSGPPATVHGLIDTMDAPTVQAATVAFGPFVRRDVLLPILPRTTLAADGYLGLDVIDGTRVTFDFKTKTMRVDQPHGYATFGNPDMSTNVRATGKAGRLQILDCVVDNVPAVAFIDTGAEVSVGNSALLSALKTRHKATPDLGRVTLTGVTGGEMEALVVPVSRIRMAELMFSDGTLAIADVPDFATWNLTRKPALLIGMDYVRQFASVSVDYRAKEFRFELSLAPPNPRPGVAIHGLG